MQFFLKSITDYTKKCVIVLEKYTGPTSESEIIKNILFFISSKSEFRFQLLTAVHIFISYVFVT